MPGADHTDGEDKAGDFDAAKTPIGKQQPNDAGQTGQAVKRPLPFNVDGDIVDRRPAHVENIAGPASPRNSRLNGLRYGGRT